jgi:hypothetical protein
MALPFDLKRWVDQAQVALEQQGSVEEAASCRFPIYAFFDALPELQGRVACTYLGLKASQRVLPLWGKWGATEGGYETLPKLMLGTAKHLFAAMKERATPSDLDTLARQITVEVNSGTEASPGEISLHTIHDLLGLACELDSLSGESPNSLYWLDWCVFLAAMNTLVEALGRDKPIDALTVEVDMWGGDPAKWAAMAYGGGIWSAFEPPSFADFSPQGTWDYSAPAVSAKRREFWMWWLLEIVPEAYFFLLK